MTQVVGIDVSKDKIDCCWIRDLQKKKIKTKPMKLTSRRHFAQVADWLERTTKHPANEIKVVMEATGIYHEPIATYLHDAGSQGVERNANRLRGYAQARTDLLWRGEEPDTVPSSRSLIRLQGNKVVANNMGEVGKH